MAALSRSVPGIVTLLRLTLESFDLEVNQPDKPVQLLVCQLFFEYVRLQIWGDAIGLTEGHGPCRLPDGPGTASVVEHCLELIRSMLNESEPMRARYGCRTIASSNTPSSTTIALANMRIISSDRGTARTTSLSSKLKWAIFDKKRFTTLVAEIKALIDGLQMITQNVVDLDRQQNMIRSHVRQINDPMTLNIMTEALVENYPDFSDVASNHADGLSNDGHQSTPDTAAPAYVESGRDESLSSHGDTEEVRRSEMPIPDQTARRVRGLIQGIVDGSRTRTELIREARQLLIIWPDEDIARGHVVRGRRDRPQTSRSVELYNASSIIRDGQHIRRHNGQ